MLSFDNKRTINQQEGLPVKSKSIQFAAERMAARKFSSVCLLLASASLGFGASTCGAGNCASCDNPCEQKNWGRVLVGAHCGSVDLDISIIEPDATQAVRFIDPCPMPVSAERYACSVFSADEWVSTMTLEFATLGFEPIRREISLPEYQSCKKEVAYVDVFCEDTGVRLSDVRYVNPCVEWKQGKEPGGVLRQSTGCGSL